MARTCFQVIYIEGSKVEECVDETAVVHSSLASYGVGRCLQDFVNVGNRNVILFLGETCRVR